MLTKYLFVHKLNSNTNSYIIIILCYGASTQHLSFVEQPLHMCYRVVPSLFSKYLLFSISNKLSLDNFK